LRIAGRTACAGPVGHAGCSPPVHERFPRVLEAGAPPLGSGSRSPPQGPSCFPPVGVGARGRLLRATDATGCRSAPARSPSSDSTDWARRVKTNEASGLVVIEPTPSPPRRCDRGGPEAGTKRSRAGGPPALEPPTALEHGDHILRCPRCGGAEVRPAPTLSAMHPPSGLPDLRQYRVVGAAVGPAAVEDGRARLSVQVRGAGTDLVAEKPRSTGPTASGDRGQPRLKLSRRSCARPPPHPRLRPTPGP